ncbi:MAG: NAD+ synthase [Candidatus Saliniplasma sp.]
MTSSKDDFDETLKIIEQFIIDKVEKTGSEKVVLGLSGGLDSATVLKLCIDALGNDKVICLIMPESASPEQDMEDARWLASKWDVKYHDIEIDSILREFPVDPDNKMAFANLKARIRMCLEYYYANVENGMVVGTSNKSELLLGYTTKYGDSASDFLPVGDIYKSDIRELAKDIGVPDRFLDKVPRAGLWEGQTDEDELGYMYEEIDEILKGIEKGYSMEKIAESNGVSIEDIQDIKGRVHRNAHKRKMPTVAKIRSGTIGVDWREFSR